MQTSRSEELQGSGSAGMAVPAARLFYGWVIVGVGILAQAFAIGLTTYTFGLFQKPVAAEFGAPFRQVGLGMTCMMVASSLMAPVLGVALDRYSIRTILLVGGLLMAAGFGLMSVAPALWMLGLLFGGIVGAGMLALGTNGCAKLVANWFVRYRGRALGISAVGTSVGGLLAPPLMALAIGRYGWRGALVCSAVAIAVIAVPLVWFTVVNRPEDVGLLPDGEAAALQPASGSTAAPDMRLGVFLKDFNFWVITLATGVCFAATSSAIVNLHPYATDLGVAAGPAALLLSCISISGIAGKLLFGAAADLVPARSAMWLAMLGLGLFLISLLLHPSYGPLMAATLLGGLALGGLLPVWGALIGRCYGRQAFGRVMGLMNTAMGPLMWVVFPFTGWVRDRTGHYDAAFITFLVALIAGSGLLALLRLPEREPGT